MKWSSNSCIAAAVTCVPSAAVSGQSLPERLISISAPQQNGTYQNAPVRITLHFIADAEAGALQARLKGADITKYFEPGACGSVGGCDKSAGVLLTDLAGDNLFTADVQGPNQWVGTVRTKFDYQPAGFHGRTDPEYISSRPPENFISTNGRMQAARSVKNQGRTVTTMRKRNLLTAVLLILPGLEFSLVGQESNSLSITGRAGSAKVVQVGGQNYVEVEGLARLTSGSINFSGNQIVITLPGTDANVPTPAAAPTGFSKDFVTAAIEAMAEQREWRAALKNAIERGYPLRENWLSALRDRAQKSLRIASVSTSTPADKDAFPFLTNQFNNMSKLSDKYLKMSKSLTYIGPKSLDNDSLDGKIAACNHSLASMATANQFVNDGSCL